MDSKQLTQKYLPMTETAYYILLSLAKPMHGYGIMQYVEEITGRRVKLGAGTIYGTLSRMEADRLIVPVAEGARRKIYRITHIGMGLLKLELSRLQELVAHGIGRMEEMADA